MALEGLVRAAKRNTPQPLPYDPAKAARIIDGTGARGNSIAAAVGTIDAEKEYPSKNWKECKHLRKGRDDGTPLCGQFMGWCAKESCKPKFMKF